MKQLIAYHGNPAIKDEYLARVRAHVAADELIKGHRQSEKLLELLAAAPVLEAA